MIAMPYLASLHASAITCSVHACGVNESLFNAIKEAGEAQHRELYSERVKKNLLNSLNIPFLFKIRIKLSLPVR